MLSRTEPMKTWCSWVTSATSVRSTSSGRSTSSTPPTLAEPVRGRLMPDSSRPSVDLPDPLGPDDGQPLAGAEPEVDAVQHVVALAVGEAEVLADEVDAVGQPVAGRAVRPDLGDAEQPARGRRADLEPVDLADQPVERVAQRLDVQHGRGDLAEVDPARASRRRPRPAG